jgi:hypothetical protein
MSFGQIMLPDPSLIAGLGLVSFLGGAAADAAKPLASDKIKRIGSGRFSSRRIGPC